MSNLCVISTPLQQWRESLRAPTEETEEIWFPDGKLLQEGGNQELFSGSARIVGAELALEEDEPIVAYARSEVRDITATFPGLALFGTLYFGADNGAIRVNFTLPFDRMVALPFSGSWARLIFGATAMVPAGATPAQRYTNFENPPFASDTIFGVDSNQFKVTAFFARGGAGGAPGVLKASRIIEDSISPGQTKSYPVARTATAMQVSGDVTFLGYKLVGTKTRGPFPLNFVQDIGAHAIECQVTCDAAAGGPQDFDIIYYLGT